MNNLIGAADYSIVHRRAIWSMEFYSNGIRWQSERLDDLNSQTITWERSQEQTWQVQPWAHNLVSPKPVASQSVTLQQPHLPQEVDQKLGHKSPPVWAMTSNLSMTSYHLIKAREKQCPTTLSKGGSGHDPPREWERTSHLLRQNESDDRSRSCSICCCPTRRSDDKDTWDELASEVKRVVESSAKAVAKAMRKIEERHAETQASIASLNQCIIPGTIGDQPLMRQLVADSSYKKWWVGVNPPKRFTSYKRRMRIRWAAMPPI